MPTIRFEFDCDDPGCLACGSDEHHVADLPAKNEVCPRCDGEGAVLTPAIAEHAYTRDEFCEEFPEDEDRAEYFAGGHGLYGVTCPMCAGRNVVSVVDEARAAREFPEALAAYLASEREDRAFERMCAAERAMGA